MKDIHDGLKTILTTTYYILKLFKALFYVMQLLKFSGWSHIKLQYIEVIGMDQSPVKYRSILSKTSYKNRYNVSLNFIFFIKYLYVF